MNATQSINAEVSRVESEVIQGAIWAPECWHLLRPVRPEWFEHQTHGQIWESLHQTCEQNAGVFDDELFVRNLKSTCPDSAQDLIALAAHISDGFCHPEHMRRYSQLMRVIGARRCTRLWSSAISAACERREPLGQIRGMAMDPPVELRDSEVSHA